ncbi:MAG: TIGR02757 family protein [Deltaproteobacteria bacterium]|nr:TIGR02757 family protein [Deltaproteobacteria bacterium]
MKPTAKTGARNEAVLRSGSLEDLYHRFNHRCFVQPDPLQFLYDYPSVRDRELAALMAASLAYGRVGQILKSVSFVLSVLGPSPRAFLLDRTHEELRSALSGFRHRFSPGEEISDLLWAARRIIRESGSLEACFAAGLGDGQSTVLPALTSFVRSLRAAGGRKGFLLARPERGSACKRWHLFLRWMVRRDDVDPGGWAGIPPSMLIVPLDTHMHRIGRGLGGTARKQADARAALEVTEMFRRVAPEDPVRYDFSLTRLGIRPEGDLEGWIAACRSGERRPT